MTDGGSDDLPPVFDTLDSITATLDGVLDRLEALETSSPHSASTGDGDGDQAPAGPAALPPVGGAVEPEIAAWVDWLVARYDLGRRFPTNWADVPGVPEEMGALRAAWVYAFDEETAAPAVGFEATQWHDSLDRVLRRIQDVWRSEHQANRHREPAGDSGRNHAAGG